MGPHCLHPKAAVNSHHLPTVEMFHRVRRRLYREETIRVVVVAVVLAMANLQSFLLHRIHLCHRLIIHVSLLLNLIIFPSAIHQ